MNRFRNFFLSVSIFSMAAASSQVVQSIPPDSPGAKSLRVHRIWTVFYHPRFSYELPVPPGVRATGVPEEEPEPKFVSGDRSFQMSAWGGMSPQSSASLVETQWRQAQARYPGEISYQRRGSTWFVVSGTDRNGIEFYEKFMTRGQQAAGLSISFPHSRLREFEGWVEKIEDGFRIISFGGSPPEIAPRLLNAGVSPALRQDRRREPSVIEEEEDENLTAGRTQPTDSGTAENNSKRSPDTARDTDAVKPSAQRKSSAASEKSFPVGVKVEGKPGFVYSPFSSDQKLVDVKGIPSGTKVKCPYTMKIFLVP